VTSLRKLEWGSLRVNFFVILNPTLMRDTPQSWITAVHLAPQQEALGNTLARDFPNLTVVDIGSVLRQIQEVVGQVIAAVEFLFLFTLCSGVLVLYAALAGSQDERVREAGLLRALVRPARSCRAPSASRCCWWVRWPAAGRQRRGGHRLGAGALRLQFRLELQPAGVGGRHGAGRGLLGPGRLGRIAPRVAPSSAAADLARGLIRSRSNAWQSQPAGPTRQAGCGIMAVLCKSKIPTNRPRSNSSAAQKAARDGRPFL
jgi:hypothetical protein